ncbi:MAG: hypothetical protein WBN57_08385 [Gammaproteobacteria bacterium]|jgi:hypothetical protein
MENDIALVATGYVLSRIGILAAFGYLFYRVLKREPKRVRVKSQSNFANERLNSRPGR